MKNIILKKCAAAALAGGTLLALTACAALPVLTPAPTATVPASVAAAPSIYAQQGKCRNHAAFSTLKTIKHPL